MRILLDRVALTASIQSRTTHTPLYSTLVVRLFLCVVTTIVLLPSIRNPIPITIRLVLSLALFGHQGTCTVVLLLVEAPELLLSCIDSDMGYSILFWTPSTPRDLLVNLDLQLLYHTFFLELS